MYVCLGYVYNHVMLFPIRDETLEALSDAQVVAPMVLTADTHSALRRNSYLYVFDYQTKYGDYPQVRAIVLIMIKVSGDVSNAVNDPFDGPKTF